MGESLRFSRPDGARVSGYLARPGRSAAPAVVVIQEWWGLNAQMRRVADAVAAAGYRALAPDLYHGDVAEDSAEASHLYDALDWDQALAQDLRGAIDFLAAEGGPVAVLGFCMGGALAIEAAARFSELAASICFYGIPRPGVIDPGAIRVPLLCHFAVHDDWCTPAEVDALERRLADGQVPYELHRYDAQHAFFNDERPEVFDAGAARLAWDRSLAFLTKHLRSGS